MGLSLRVSDEEKRAGRAVKVQNVQKRYDGEETVIAL